MPWPKTFKGAFGVLLPEETRETFRRVAKTARDGGTLFRRVRDGKPRVELDLSPDDPGLRFSFRVPGDDE